MINKLVSILLFSLSLAAMQPDQPTHRTRHKNSLPMPAHVSEDRDYCLDIPAPWNKTLTVGGKMRNLRAQLEQGLDYIVGAWAIGNGLGEGDWSMNDLQNILPKEHGPVPAKIYFETSKLWQTMTDNLPIVSPVFYFAFNPSKDQFEYIDSELTLAHPEWERHKEFFYYLKANYEPNVAARAVYQYRLGKIYFSQENYTPSKRWLALAKDQSHHHGAQKKAAALFTHLLQRESEREITVREELAATVLSGFTDEAPAPLHKRKRNEAPDSSARTL